MDAGMTTEQATKGLIDAVELLTTATKAVLAGGERSRGEAATLAAMAVAKIEEVAWLHYPMPDLPGPTAPGEHRWVDEWWLRQAGLAAAARAVREADAA